MFAEFEVLDLEKIDDSYAFKSKNLTLLFNRWRKYFAFSDEEDLSRACLISFTAWLSISYFSLIAQFTRCFIMFER